MINFLKNLTDLQDIVIKDQTKIINKQDKEITSLKTSKEIGKILTEVESHLGSFVVKIDNIAAAQTILDVSETLGFSIPRGAKHIESDGSSLLSFFFDGDNDVSLITHWEEGFIKNLKPVLSAGSDFYEIVDRIHSAAAKKVKLCSSSKDRNKTFRSLFLQTASEVHRVIANPTVKEKPQVKQDINDIYVEDCGMFLQITQYTNGKLVKSEVVAKNSLRDYVSEIVIIG